MKWKHFPHCWLFVEEICRFWMDYSIVKPIMLSDFFEHSRQSVELPVLSGAWRPCYVTKFNELSGWLFTNIMQQYTKSFLNDSVDAVPFFAKIITGYAWVNQATQKPISFLLSRVKHFMESFCQVHLWAYIDACPFFHHLNIVTVWVCIVQRFALTYVIVKKLKKHGLFGLLTMKWT